MIPLNFNKLLLLLITFDFNNVLINVELNIKINKCFLSNFYCYFALMLKNITLL